MSTWELRLLFIVIHDYMAFVDCGHSKVISIDRTLQLIQENIDDKPGVLCVPFFHRLLLETFDIKDIIAIIRFQLNVSIEYFSVIFEEHE